MSYYISMQHQKPFAQASEQVLRDQINNHVIPTKSEHYQYYQQQINRYSTLLSSKALENLENNLSKQGIIFSSSLTPRQSLQLTIVSTSINKEVVMMQARWGQFEVNIKILNIIEDNIMHPKMQQNNSSIKIIAGTFLSRRLVLKCIEVNSMASRRNAIKQWMLLKIGSAMETGPKVPSYFGFDILMYEKCIQFPMELCEKVLGPSQLNSSLLYWNLAVMHHYHIVHCDIKPENIMLSPYHKKIVFIDFGLSKVIKEQIGQKTLTTFVGTINFCSEEMAKCLFLEDPRPIDLYFNDLRSLEASFKSIQDTYEDPCYQPPQTQYQELDQLVHLSIYLLKFYLFRSQLSQFHSFWNQLRGAGSLRDSASHILEFLRQLEPSSVMKNFFDQFTANEIIDRDSSQFSLLKLAYEISYQNIFSICILQDHDKELKFSGYIKDLQTQNQIRQKQFQGKRDSVAKLMLNRERLAKTPHTDYVSLYLKYMSYSNNQFRVDASARFEAAKIYYYLYISQQQMQIPSNNIVPQTIIHILQRFLASRYQDASSCAIIAFQLFDFITILDIGTAQQFMRWLNSIMDHKDLSDAYRLLLSLRVYQSNVLNEYRVKGKGQKSRFQFFLVVSQWANEKIKVLSQVLGRNLNSGSTENFMRSFSPSKEFVEQCGEEDIKLAQSFKGTRLNKKAKEQLYSKYSYQLIRSSKHRRFAYYAIIIFKHYYYLRNNTSICKNIYNILRQNIADQEIMSQFSFEFLINSAFFMLTHVIQNEQTLVGIINYLIRINPKDLIFFSSEVRNLHNKLSVLSLSRVLASEVQAQAHLVFARYLQAEYEFSTKAVMEGNHYHICNTAGYFLDNLLLSKSIKWELNLQLRSIFKKDMIEKISCSKCRENYLLANRLISIQEYLTQYCSGYTSKALDIQDIPDKMFKEIFDLQDYVSSLQNVTVNFYTSFLNSLRLGQLLCCLNEDLEDKYHGILHYYEVVSSNMLSVFFNVEYQISFHITKTLKVLEGQGDRHIEFLFKMVKHLEKTLLYRDFYLIWWRCSQFFQKHSDQQLSHCFQLISAYRRAHNETTHAIVIIFSIFLRQTHSTQLARCLLAQILKSITFLHYRIRRQVVLQLLCRQCDRLEGTKESRRKWLYCNNRLARQAMIDAGTVPRKLKNRSTKKGVLVDKTLKIEVGRGVVFRRK